MFHRHIELFVDLPAWRIGCRATLALFTTDRGISIGLIQKYPAHQLINCKQRDAVKNSTDSRHVASKNHYQSMLAPEFLTTLAHFVISLLIMADSCSGVLLSRIAPWLASRSRRSGIATTFAI